MAWRTSLVETKTKEKALGAWVMLGSMLLLRLAMASNLLSLHSQDLMHISICIAQSGFVCTPCKPMAKAQSQ